MTKTENIILWKDRFADRLASGLKVDDWFEKNNVSRHAYYYWHCNVQDALRTLPNKFLFCNKKKDFIKIQRPKDCRKSSLSNL